MYSSLGRTTASTKRSMQGPSKSLHNTLKLSFIASRKYTSYSIYTWCFCQQLNHYFYQYFPMLIYNFIWFFIHLFFFLRLTILKLYWNFLNCNYQIRQDFQSFLLMNKCKKYCACKEFRNWFNLFFLIFRVFFS